MSKNLFAEKESDKASSTSEEILMPTDNSHTDKTFIPWKNLLSENKVGLD